MVFESIRVGIMFNAFVSSIVAIIAFVFSIFLFIRWHRLDTALRAYTGFWVMTTLVWVFSAARYLFIGTGFFAPAYTYYGSLVHLGDIIVQGAVFFTGPPLFYYVTIRVFGKDRIAVVAAFISFLLGSVALWLIVKPNGLSTPVFTFFSADASINTASLLIFGIEIVVLIFMLVYDTVTKIQLRRATRNTDALFHALYSISLLVYVMLGGIDQSKIILDWPLIVFRVFYGGAFLMAYLTIIQHETSHD